MAQITLTIPDVHVPRILTALGAANAAEAKTNIINYLKGTVIIYENLQLREAQDAQVAQDLNDLPIT